LSDKKPHIQSNYRAFNEKLIRVGCTTSRLFSKNTLDEVLDEVYNILTNVLEQKWVGIGKVTGNQLKFIRVTTEETLNKSLSLTGKGITVRAANTGEIQLVPDTRQDPDYMLIASASPLLSEVDVPVKLDGLVRYVINVESPIVDGFSREDVTLIELLSVQMGAALKTVLSKQRMIEYVEELQTLSKAMAGMNLCDSVEALVEFTLDIVEALMNVPYSAYLQVNSGKLEAVSMRGVPLVGMQLDIAGPGITSRAARLKKPVLVKDIRLEPDFIRGPMDSLSELAVPVLVGDEVVGVINMESLEPDYFTDRHLQLALILSAHISNNILRLKTEEEKIRSEKEMTRIEAKAEAAERLSQLKTRLMSTATHELRTPLTAIRGYLELIETTLDEDIDAAKQYFKVVQRNTQRLTKLTEDLLEQQRIEEGKMNISREPFNVKPFVDHVVEELKPLLDTRDQVLEVHCVDCEVIGDLLRLSQVLINLIGNASKFSPRGSNILLDVVDYGDEVRFSVTDHGVGIKEEDMDKLFTPFPGIRVSGVKDSTGLGLSICKGIVKLHGGRIWAESEGLGKGSTFTFTIPK